MRSFRHLLLLSTMITAASASAFAQVANSEIEFEGPITGFVAAADNPAGTGPQIKVMGATINLRTATSITTPTGTLSLDQLMSTVPLPGRDEPGFVGATATITGESDAETAWAHDVFVEPSENIMLGTVRLNSNRARNRGFDVENAQLVLLPPRPTANSYPAIPKTRWGGDTHPLYDPRFKGTPMENSYGFRIRPATIPAGTLVSAEGYYSSKLGKFLAFLVEADAGELTRPDVPQVSIQRAQCRERDANTIDLEVRGSIHDPAATAGATGNVNIFRPPLDGVPRADYGTEPAVADAGTFGVYDYDARITTTEGCPPKVRAQIFALGRRYSATSDVEIRID